MEAKQAYYAIIPANVRYDKTLAPNAKLLYGEITALCNREGFCWAENAYFANLYEVNDRTIRRWINSLVDNGYILRNIQYENDGKTVLRRCLSIVATSNVPTHGQKCPQGDDENARGVGSQMPDIIIQDNSTSDNYIELDDVGYNNAPARDENGKIDVEMWITHNLKGVKHPEFQQISCQACFKSTDVLEYVCETLDAMLRSNTPLFVKDKMYQHDEVVALITEMTGNTLCFLTQGFYEVDQINRRFVRKHVSNPVSYIVTVLANAKNTPLKKVVY